MSVKYNEKFFVITGGPGSGKSELLKELALYGYYQCVPEIARGIIQEQVAAGGDALPWGDTIRYRDIMLDRSITTYDEAVTGSGPETRATFFDRGIIDVLGYTRIIGGAIDERLSAAARDYRYNAKVCIAPPWSAIYRNDAERKQSFRESIAVYDTMVKTYLEHDYELIEIPRESPGGRASFVLRALGVPSPVKLPYFSQGDIEQK